MRGSPASRASWHTTARGSRRHSIHTRRAGPARRPVIPHCAAIHWTAVTHLHRRGEARLGRMAIVDRDDDGVGPDAEIATERIVRVDAAKHPAAAVEIHHDRMRSGACRTVAVGMPDRRRRPVARRRRWRRPPGPAAESPRAHVRTRERSRGSATPCAAGRVRRRYRAASGRQVAAGR